MLDDHDGCIGHVDADFDHGGGEQGEPDPLIMDERFLAAHALARLIEQNAAGGGKPGRVEILASHGIRLGGTDFDQALSLDPNLNPLWLAASNAGQGTLGL